MSFSTAGMSFSKAVMAFSTATSRHFVEKYKLFNIFFKLTMSETCDNSDYSYYDAIYFDITEFLTEYEKLPCLWDRTHEHFKNRETRAKAEEILSQKLGIMDSKTLRRKIRSVRGSYNTEIRKVKLSLESGHEVYVPRLSWFHLADSFLRVTTDLSSDIVVSPIGSL